jgi:hypothetical protein
MGIRWHRGRAAFFVAVTLCAHPMPAPAADRSTVVAQAPSSIEEKVRATSTRLASYRKLLDDPDAQTRLAAIDEMTRSSDLAVREMAFDAGLASAEAAVRAVALRARLATAKSLVFELMNTKNLPADDWIKLTKPFGGEKLVLTNVVINPANGDLTAHNSSGRLAGQELQIAFSSGALRVRLAEGTVMVGSCTYATVTVPCRLPVQ